MSAVSRRRFLTGGAAVAAVLGRRDPEPPPTIENDHRAVLESFVESGARGTLDGAVGPSHGAVHMATAAALLDLSPEKENQP